MSKNGTDVEVRLTAIGGDQAAAEIQKPADALEESVRDIRRAQEGRALAEFAGQIGEIGEKFQEVSKSVEVFDAELAAKLRNTGENISAVSGVAQSAALGFATGGPVGAAIGGLGSMLGGLVQSYVQAGQAAVESAAESARAFGGLTDKLAGVEAAKNALNFEAFVTGLRSEEAAIQDQNEALQRNRTLLEAKLAAEAKLASAKAQTEMAKIDADPTLSNAEKVERKAEIRENLERERAAAGVAKQARDVAAAEKAAQDKAAAAARAAEDAKAVAQRAEERETERKELEQSERARTSAKEALPGASAKAATATRKAELLRRVPFLTGPQEEADVAQARLEELRNQANRNPQNEVRLKELRVSAAAEKAAAEKASAEAARLAEEARKADLDAANQRKIFGETAPLAVQTYQEESGGRAATTRAAVDAARSRQAEQQRQLADQQRKEAEQAQRQDQALQSDAAGLAQRAAQLVPAGATDAFRRQVDRAAAGLQDGDQGGELKTLLDLISRLADATEKRRDSSSTDIRKIEQKIKVLEGQVSNRPRS